MLGSSGEADGCWRLSYEAWKDVAAKELQRLHGIEATVISEREWTKLYIRGLALEEAADRAERDYRSTRPPDWIKKEAISDRSEGSMRDPWKDREQIMANRQTALTLANDLDMGTLA